MTFHLVWLFSYAPTTSQCTPDRHAPPSNALCDCILMATSCSFPSLFCDHSHLHPLFTCGLSRESPWNLMMPVMKVHDVIERLQWQQTNQIHVICQGRWSPLWRFVFVDVCRLAAFDQDQSGTTYITFQKEVRLGIIKLSSNWWKYSVVIKVLKWSRSWMCLEGYIRSVPLPSRRLFPLCDRFWWY